MQILNSYVKPLIPVTLPWRGRQKYMHTFDLASPSVPAGYEDYLDVVKSLCKAAGATEGLAHMTIDEKIVPAGMSQRRPGPHVDGCFMPSQMIWGHDGPGWLHTCNNISGNVIARMPIITAASVKGCKVYEGKYDATPKSDGDLSHVADGLPQGVLLSENYGYYLSPDCIHESIIFKRDTKRTFLRIALPTDFVM